MCQHLNPKTLQHNLLSAKHWHITQDLDDPTASTRVKQALKGALNTYAKPTVQAEALTEVGLHQMTDYLLSAASIRSIRN